MNNINSIRLELKSEGTHGPSRQGYSLVAGLLLAAVLEATATTRTGCDSGATCADGVILLVFIGALRATSVHLVLGCFKVNCCLTRFLGFQRSLLGGTTWYRIKGGTANQVLEVLTRGEEDAHACDVLGGERFAAFRTLAGQRQPKVAEVIEYDFLALQQLFHEAAAHVGQYAFHLSALVTAMLGDVSHKLAEVHHFFHLRLGVSLGRLALVNLVGKHVNTVINHTCAHCRYGTWYLRKQSVAPDRDCYHRTAWQNYNAG